MKVALITDTHWGVRNDNSAFLQNNKMFLENIFFPTLEKEGIDTIIHLGDLVDRRKYINFNTANRLREDFLDKISNKYDTHIIAGNHDTFYKNTNDINALRELVTDNYVGVHCYSRPTEIDLDGCMVLLLPWICDDNREESYELIKNSKARVVMGHLELEGFEMFRGSVATHGDDSSIFGRFDLVCSGHYHHRSRSGNVTYLGSHAEFTWSDYDDDRGFHILDTDTLELTFIKNPYTMFAKIVYDDADPARSQDVVRLEGKMVKVIVRNKNDLYKFDRFIESIEKVGVLNMQVVEDHYNLNSETEEDIVDEAESTIDIFKKYISQIDLPDSGHKKLESIIVSLYQEALTVS
jgi:predicted phosphodiesterase